MFFSHHTYYFPVAVVIIRVIWAKIHWAPALHQVLYLWEVDDIIHLSFCRLGNRITQQLSNLPSTYSDQPSLEVAKDGTTSRQSLNSATSLLDILFLTSHMGRFSMCLTSEGQLHSQSSWLYPVKTSQPQRLAGVSHALSADLRPLFVPPQSFWPVCRRGWFFSQT